MTRTITRSTHPISMRLPLELHDKLVELAEKEDTTPSLLAREIVERAVRRRAV